MTTGGKPRQHDITGLLGKDEEHFLFIQNQAARDVQPIFVFNWFEELKRLVPTE